MRIVSMRVLRGPNRWSTYRTKLIQMTLDLEEMEDYPTNLLDGFGEQLERIMPSLVEHRCSEGHRGGFFERVRTGTWLGHVIEHVALELQSLAGMEAGYGRTRSAAQRGLYSVVMEYEVEAAGIYAANAAYNIVSKLAAGVDCDITPDIRELACIAQREGLGPSTKALCDAAKERGIPFTRLDNGSLIRLGQGQNQKIICATVVSTTSAVAMDIASDKQKTREILEQGYLPIAAGAVISEESELESVIKHIGFPIVIKPVDGNHGRGVKVNIQSAEVAKAAFHNAKKFGEDILVERFVEGHDYRFLLVNHNLYAVGRRSPASIRGNSKSTISELIDEVNADPRRGEGHEKVMTTIKVDEITKSILVEKKLTLNSVLPFGEILYLKDAANLSAGGTCCDVTEIVHPHNVFLAERAARLIGLDVCGIDIIAKDISKPLDDDNGAILEVNACPGLRMHLFPAEGKSKNVAAPILDLLYPKNAPSRIPIVAITGTNGKTTTTRLMSHFAKAAGHNVGFTSTDGIFINDQQVCAGDCSGPSSAEVILRDPIVDFAVFECARGGILRAGLGFDKCNISIITNITEDHLGLDGINSLRQLAEVKEVIARSTFDSGFAILNADDDYVYRMIKNIDCNIALFSMDPQSERVQRHCEEGGWAAIVEEGYFTVRKGDLRFRIAKVVDTPLTIGGTATCMIKNILPATLAAVLSGIEIPVIQKAVLNFIPGPEQTPGRMNIFEFDDFKIVLDYAHNGGGFDELEQFVRNIDGKKFGVITSPGDRRDEDIINVGKRSAEIFDEIIIRHDNDCRGRKPEDITKLLKTGICQSNPGIPVHVVSDELEALLYSMQIVPAGGTIVACIDDVKSSIELVQRTKEEGLQKTNHTTAKVLSLNHNDETEGNTSYNRWG
jgi:cyanophycin synthetase